MQQVSKAAIYCKVHRLPFWIAEILHHLPQSYWWLFSTAATKREDYIIVKPGYYSGYGQYSKKISLANDVKLAAARAGKKHKIFNISKRNGITGLRILINNGTENI